MTNNRDRVTFGFKRDIGRNNIYFNNIGTLISTASLNIIIQQMGDINYEIVNMLSSQMNVF